MPAELKYCMPSWLSVSTRKMTHNWSWQQKAREGNKQLRETYDLFADFMGLINFILGNLKHLKAGGTFPLMAVLSGSLGNGTTLENRKRSNIKYISEMEKKNGRNYTSITLTYYLKTYQTTFKTYQGNKDKRNCQEQFLPNLSSNLYLVI